MLTLWVARKVGLSDDDLRVMAMDEFDAWIELHEWTTSTEDDHATMGPSDSERAFFHM